MKKQKTIFQMKEQDKTSEKNLSETDFIYPDRVQSNSH